MGPRGPAEGHSAEWLAHESGAATGICTFPRAGHAVEKLPERVTTGVALALHFPLAVVIVLIAGGFAAEIVAAISRRAFLRLQAPPMRVCGCDTPFPLVFEPVYMPSAQRVYDAIVASATF